MVDLCYRPGEEELLLDLLNALSPNGRAIAAIYSKATAAKNGWPAVLCPGCRLQVLMAAANADGLGLQPHPDDFDRLQEVFDSFRAVCHAGLGPLEVTTYE